MYIRRLKKKLQNNPRNSILGNRILIVPSFHNFRIEIDEPFYHEQLLPDCSLINQIITWINDIVKYADITCSPGIYLRFDSRTTIT